MITNIQEEFPHREAQNVRLLKERTRSFGGTVSQVKKKGMEKFGQRQNFFLGQKKGERSWSLAESEEGCTLNQERGKRDSRKRERR